MEQIKQKYRDLSLRTSIILYFIVFSLLAVYFISVVSQACRYARDQINASYPPIEYERYYLTNEKGERLGDGTNIAFEDISYSEDDQRILTVLSGIETFAPVSIYALCMLTAVFIFYKSKLKPPLTVLNQASARIAENDLDFYIDYEGRDEMGRLCGSFEKMRSSLLENNRLMWRQMEQRKQVNAAFAHDLRTPLAVLKGCSEILLESREEQTKETSAVMSRNIRRLEQYVDSMSRLRKMEDIRANYEMTRLSGLMGNVREMAEIVCANAGKIPVFYSRFENETVALDSEIISGVIENLISNAVRYAEKKITLKMILKQNTLEISVEDDGQGFLPEAVRRGDEPYYTSDGKGAEHFGLGLYICKVLTGHHGGELRLYNLEKGAGVTATFEVKDKKIK